MINPIPSVVNYERHVAPVCAAPPKINVPPRFREVCTFEKGENVVLKIPFTGNPKPTVKWIRDGEELRGSRYVHEVTERHAILTIKVRAAVAQGRCGVWCDDSHRDGHYKRGGLNGIRTVLNFFFLFFN